MDKLNNLIHFYMSSIMAGIIISISGTVFLSVDNQIIGSLLFGIGLFIILSFQMNLFTGKVGYLLNSKPTAIFNLILIWCGNLIGIELYSQALYYIRQDLAIKATKICNEKLLQLPQTTLFLGIMCGLLMYIAVDNFITNKSDLGKHIGIFMCVSVFILCRFEHCIADMFYFSMMNDLSIFSFIVLKYIAIVTLGNTIGALIIPIINKTNKNI